LAGLSDHLGFCGQFDQNLSALQSLIPVVLGFDGDRIRLSGDAKAVDAAHLVLQRMHRAAQAGALLTPDDVRLAARDVLREGEVPRVIPATLHVTHRGREIRPKTAGQRAFVEAIEANELTFGIGPAGTGKTFLATVMAVRALRERKVRRIILSRPAVEAGESLGFLPGALKEKVDPYLRPLYDALSDLLDDTVVARHLEKGVIEVAPLAYMRGRTLSEAFVILDEAQNATREQLKMFVTRLGDGSRMVVSGDVTQIDLPRGVTSGLPEAPEVFRAIPRIAVVHLGDEDVVRPPLVAEIIRAYARRRT
jgi:phosphate starvation-inducible PhoH-like protein